MSHSALPHDAPETFRIERRLTSAQSARRDRALEAARALAAEGGYAAVTMQEVAARAGVSRATLYRYFASKDHLLAEVIAAWGRELTAALRRDPPRGDRAARVAGVFVRVLEAARAEPRLAAAVLASATSADPEAIRAQDRFASLPRDYLSVAGVYAGEAEAEAPDAARRTLETVMGHVFFSCLVHTTAGRLSHEDAVRALEDAARLACGAAGGPP